MVASPSVKDQIIKQLDTMTNEQLKLVLGYTQIFGNPLPSGIPGEALLERARDINFDPGGQVL